MRNLKRVLSLVMAVAMLIGLMVVSASAASTYDNFTDKDEIVNTEAVNTMVSLGVINGKEDGSYFDPAGIVTRAEMAKLIAVALNGGKDPLLGTGAVTTQFSDVASNYWAAPYIAYCANLGIINGKGNGTFGPEEPVTGTAAAKMMLTALGYRSDIEGLTGTGWDLNTDTLANKVGLYDGMSIVPSNGLSRDNTAQLIYNGVQADEVEYRNNYGEYSGVIYAQPNGTMLANRFGVVKVEGIVVANEIFGLSDYSATPAGKTRFVDCNTYSVVQNGVTITKAYDNVYPVSVSNDYVGQRVVIYVKFPNALAPNATDCVVIGEPILSSKNTVATTGAKLGNTDKVKSFLRDNGLSIGAEQLDNGNANTNRGVLTVANNVFNFVDGNVSLADGVNARGTKITFIDNTGDGTVDYILKETKHLAKVTVYNADKGELTLAGVGNINFKDIANEDAVAAGDIVQFVKYDETYYFDIPETVKGTFSAYNADAVTMIMDGTSYASTSVGFNAASTDLMPYTISKDEIGNTYTLYLDDFGNVIAVELADEALGNYALVLKTATTASGSSSVLNKGEVKLLKADGTTATYTVNLAASGARFGWASATNSTKETNMIGLLTNTDGNNDGIINPPTGGDAYSALTNTIVTYIVGEDGTVTLGNPAQETAYDSLYRAAGVGTVKSTQTSYTFASGSDKDGATAAFPGHSSTTANTTVVLNDSTLFFFRDTTNSDASDPVVVQGLKNLPASAIASSNLISAVYRTDTTNTNVAKAVYVDAAYEGAVNYLYLEADYTATELTSTGERIYTYPVVFEDGTAGTIKVREANNTGFTSGSIYAYTTDGEYYKLDPSKEIAGGANGSASTNETVNGYVVVHSQADTITMQWGLNNDSATNGGYVQKAFKVNANTKVINVETSGAPYDAKSISANSTVALATDSDGFVRVAFVKDSNVSFRTVTNNTGANLTVANVPSAKQNVTSPLADGSSITMASGFSFSFDQTYNVAATYSKTTDGGEKTEGLTVKGNSSNYASITMPAYATLTIGTGSTTPTPSVDANSSAADVNTALTKGDVNLTGIFAPAEQVVVPNGKTLTVTGKFNPAVMPKIQGTGKIVVAGDATMPTGNFEGTLEVSDTLTLGGDIYVIGSIVVGDSITNAGNLVLNGKDMDGTGTVTVNGTLTLGSSISGSLTVNAKYAEIVANFTMTGGTLTIENGIASTGSFTLTVSGGTLAVEAGTVKANLTISGDADVTVGDVTGTVENNGTGDVTTGIVSGGITGDVTVDVTRILEEALAYKYEPAYTRNGQISVSGSTITYTGSHNVFASEVGGVGGNIKMTTADLARLMGALWRFDEGKSVTSVTYKGVKYTWDAEGGLTGSNWKATDTLMKALAADIATAFKDAEGTGYKAEAVDATFDLTINDTVVTLSMHKEAQA